MLKWSVFNEKPDIIYRVMKEIDIQRIFESSKINDPDHKRRILSSLAEIANREQITEDNCDVKDIPWENYDFSRRILPLASKSREQSVIETDFIEEECRLEPGMRILDIASGDGRLSLEFARRGYIVTGVDKSPYAIEYSIMQSKQQGLNNCHFIHGNAADITIENGFHAALIIYGAIANLTQNEAARLVKKLSELIVTGGSIVIEVCCILDNITTDYQEWYFSDSGLWGDSVYLILTENFFNVKESYMAIRHWVLDIIDGSYRLVTGREQYYSLESIAELLISCGFRIESVYSDWNRSQYTGENEIMIIHAKLS